MTRSQSPTALSSITNAGLFDATTRARTPSGSVRAAPRVWPDGNPNSTGPGKSRTRAARVSLPRTCPSGSSQPGKFAEDDRARTRHDPREAQLGPQPVDAIRALVHVLEEQHAPAWRAEGKRRPERRGQLGEVAAVDRPERLARLQDLDPWRPEFSERFVPGNRPKQRMPVVGGRAPLQPAGDGGAVEGGQAAGARHEREQRGQVAVADDRFARLPDGGRVEQRQDVDAAIPATRRHHCADRTVRERGADGGRARFRGAGDVGLAVEHRRLEDRLEAEPAEFGQPRLQFFRTERAGWRDDGDSVARAECAWFQHRVPTRTA